MQMLDRVGSAYSCVVKNTTIHIMGMMVVNRGGAGAWRGDQALVSIAHCLAGGLIPKGGKH